MLQFTFLFYLSIILVSNVKDITASRIPGLENSTNETELDEPYVEGKPTVFGSRSFIAHDDAARLYNALRSSSTKDEVAVVDVLTSRNSRQRTAIAEEYKKLYGKDLEKEIKNELSSSFRDVCIALVRQLSDYYATELNYATEGVGTDERLLSEILASVDNQMLLAIQNSYTLRYQKSLEKSIQDDTSGAYERLLVLTLQGTRDTTQNQRLNFTQINADVDALYGNGTESIKHDESNLIRILALRSKPHLRAVFSQYKHISGNKFTDALKSAYTLGTETGFVTYVKVIQNPTIYFSKRLNGAMSGIGTDDRTLTRVIITRSEVDLASIKLQFAHDYGKTLSDAITGDTSGAYMAALVALQGGPESIAK